MNIRNKTLSIVGITFVVLITTLVLTSRLVVLKSFSDLEDRQTRLNVSRVQNELRNILTTLAATAADWAQWDETYTFVQDGNSDYIRDNLMDITFTNLRVNLMVFIDSSGQVIHGKCMDLTEGRPSPLPADLQKSHTPTHLLLDHPDRQSIRSGLSMLPEGPMLMVSRPILRSDGTGPARGTMLMGRYLDSNEVERISNKTHLVLAVHPLSNPDMPVDVSRARSLLSGPSAIAVNPLGARSIAGYTLLEDMQDQPILILRVLMPRVIYQHGRTAVLYSVLWLVGISILFSLLIVVLLEKTTLSRLSRLSTEVMTIARRGDSSLRLPAYGEDELGSFADVINSMLESLEHTQVELERNEGRYRAIVEDQTELICRFQPDGPLTFVNDACCRYFDQEREELIGQRFTALFMAEDRAAVETGLADLDHQHPVATHELRISSPAGEIRWLQWTHRAIYDDRENLIEIQAVGRDITDRKRTEETLRETERDKSLILDSTAEMFAYYDKDRRVKWVNKAAADFVGAKPEELIGRYCYEVWHKSEEPCRVCPLLAGYQTGLPQEAEIVSTDGRAWFLRGYPLVGEDGEVQGLIEFGQDITHRKRSEKALRESEERYRDLFENASDLIFSVDMDGRFIYVNRAWRNTLDYDEGEVSRLRIFDIISPEYRPHCMGILQQLSSGQDFNNVRTTIMARNGQSIVVEGSLSCKYKDGKPVSIRAIFRNITERTQAEEQKRRLEARLQETRKMEAIGTLAGGIAHEFNNALAAIFGHIDLLELDWPHDEKLQDNLGLIRVSARRMTLLTSQLIAYARGGKCRPRDVSLTRFVEETLRSFEHAMKSGIEIETDLASDIPLVEVDLAQMQMVFSALITNAVEAMDGQGRIRISTGTESISTPNDGPIPGLRPGRYVYLTVEDDGKGMAADTRERIFEPFYSTKFQGRGLGMAAVYGVVKNHEGHVVIESEPGKGTAVRLFLPTAGTPEAVGGQSEEKLVAGSGGVLLIEDEEVVRSVSRTILERLGYQVWEAATGQEAVEMVKTLNGRIDVALLDIALPDMGGVEVFRNIKSTCPELKVILCSGYAIDGPAQEILDAGAQDFIQKPCSFSILSTKLKKVLETG